MILEHPAPRWRGRVVTAITLIALATSVPALALTQEWELVRTSLSVDRPPVQDDGTVVIRIGEEPSRLFPRHLKEIGVERIRLEFDAPGGARRTFSMVWTGGSQGPDQLAVRVDGVPAGVSTRVATERYPYQWYCDELFVRLGPQRHHVIEIAPAPGITSEMQLTGLRLAGPEAPRYRPLCYESIGPLERYEEALGDKGVRIDGEEVTVYAPASHSPEARKLAAFLDTAYAEMRSIYGLEPVFRFSVEHYPKDHERGWGGISGAGTIGYEIGALERFRQLGTRDMRGFAGYTEEMSHGFKSCYRCGGTYEALGVAVQADVARGLASERTVANYFDRIRRECEETVKAYERAGHDNPDPERFPWNVFYTRILNHLFFTLRDEYGEEMWPDFFRTLRQMDLPLHRAEKSERMRVYVNVFSTIFGRDMEGRFRALGIDPDADPPWGWKTHEGE